MRSRQRGSRQVCNLSDNDLPRSLQVFPFGRRGRMDIDNLSDKLGRHLTCNVINILIQCSATQDVHKTGL
jgi:hypothetical protein